jgi:hypothetical protein
MSNYIITNGELRHWGIKGMKWGVRRYQNADGTLTPAGQKRYDRDIRENNAKKKDNRMTIEGPDARRWVKEDNTRAKSLADQTKSAVGSTKNLVDKYWADSKKEKLDMSNLSNKEMRDRIERAKVEREYEAMFAPEKKSKGKAIVNAAFSITSGALTATSTVLGLALAAQQLGIPELIRSAKK